MAGVRAGVVDAVVGTEGESAVKEAPDETLRTDSRTDV